VGVATATAGRVSNFTIVFRKVCATQVFSIAGLCDENNSGEYTAYKLKVVGAAEPGSGGSSIGMAAPAAAPVDYSQYYNDTAKDMLSPAATTPSEPTASAPAGGAPAAPSWFVNRRFTEFDELRKRIDDDLPIVAQWSDLFPSKFSVDEVQAMFDPEKRLQVRESRQRELGAWLSKVVQLAPQHPGLVAFLTPDEDEDVVGAGGCTSIGSVSLVENQKHNEGITWGVDDLDRRRHLVMERCTVAGKSFAEGAVVPLRVQNGKVKADKPGEALYTFPPRLSIYWDEE